MNITLSPRFAALCTASAVFLFIQTSTAQAQSPANAALATTASKVAGGNEAVCKRETERYQETLKFLKTTAGDKITDMVKTGIIDDKQLSELIAKDGYCGVARVLKERKLV
jgi:hypothetical protein